MAGVISKCETRRASPGILLAVRVFFFAWPDLHVFPILLPVAASAGRNPWVSRIRVRALTTVTRNCP